MCGVVVGGRGEGGEGEEGGCVCVSFNLRTNACSKHGGKSSVTGAPTSLRHSVIPHMGEFAAQLPTRLLDKGEISAPQQAVVRNTMRMTTTLWQK